MPFLALKWVWPNLWLVTSIKYLSSLKKTAQFSPSFGLFCLSFKYLVYHNFELNWHQFLLRDERKILTKCLIHFIKFFNSTNSYPCKNNNICLKCESTLNASSARSLFFKLLLNSLNRIHISCIVSYKIKAFLPLGI